MSIIGQSKTVSSLHLFQSATVTLRNLLISALTAVLWTCSVSSSNTEAAAGVRHHYGHSYGSRSSAAAARANRARMINSIQQQVSNARQILKAAETKSEMTQAQVAEASTKLSGIRREIDGTQHDAVEAAKTLHAIAAEITLHQSPTSELSKAIATADEAKLIVHQTIHRVLNLPFEEAKPDVDIRRADLQQLSDSQRSTLNADPRYTAAEQGFKDAAGKVSRLRQKTFEADSDWVAAHRDLVNAHRQTKDGEKQRLVTGTAAFEKKKELQNANNIADTARSIISNGEYRLRQFGVSTNTTKSPSRPSPNSAKKK
ncbi:MAG: hypothetical protein NTX48_10085 [Planctomycetales bacterium]|nr:hypothetical protein [Planctomycetales bacterium]